MPKLDIEKIKRKGIAVFDTKIEMLKYIKKTRFNNSESLEITRYEGRWFIQWKVEDK